MVGVGVVVVGIIISSPAVAAMMMVMMTSIGSSLLLSSLVDGRSLGDAVIVALPNNVGVCREGE